MERVATVVIGSGVNALTAAALSAKAGRRTLILEREARIGGCMRTEELAPGFLHDVMAATFVLFTTSPAFAALGKDLARHGLAFANTDDPTAVLLPDGRSLVLSTDRAANAAAFEAAAAGDGAALRREIGIVEQDAGLLFGLLGGALYSFATARLLLREARRRGVHALLGRFGEALRPSRAWLEDTFQSELARALFAPWALHAGLGPEQAFSGEITRIIAFALEAAGAPVAVGGAGRAADAFAALIREHGGELRTGADVDEILVARGRATGVRLADGTEIAADRVVASVTPTQLYGRLLRAGAPLAEAAPTRRFRYGKGDMQVNYALRSPPRWRTAGLDRVALIHLTSGLDGVSRAVNECERGLLPAEPTICVGQPAALDPTRCPDGAGVLWVQLPETPRHVNGDAAAAIAVPADGRWTPALRENYADRIDAVLARHIDDFAATVVARKAYSPADLEAMNMNLVGGDPYGGSTAVDQFFVWRPFSGSTNHRTSVKGLYHIGASTHPGPGLAGGSGFAVGSRLP